MTKKFAHVSVDATFFSNIFHLWLIEPTGAEPADIWRVDCILFSSPEFYYFVLRLFFHYYSSNISIHYYDSAFNLYFSLLLRITGFWSNKEAIATLLFFPYVCMRVEYSSTTNTWVVLFLNKPDDFCMLKTFHVCLALTSWVQFIPIFWKDLLCWL